MLSEPACPVGRAKSASGGNSETNNTASLLFRRCKLKTVNVRLVFGLKSLVLVNWLPVMVTGF